jgi:hypothetical protein
MCVVLQLLSAHLYAGQKRLVHGYLVDSMHFNDDHRVVDDDVQFFPVYPQNRLRNPVLARLLGEREKK